MERRPKRRCISDGQDVVLGRGSEVRKPVTDHAALAAMVSMLCDQTTTILAVGVANVEVFTVKADLLALLYPTFAKFLNESNGEDLKTTIKEEPNVLVDFIMWLNTGRCINTGSSLTKQDMLRRWLLGEDLNTPAFQNIWMRAYMERCKLERDTWPSPDGVDDIYSKTKTNSDSMLRKYAAASIACKNPANLQPGNVEFKLWQAVFARHDRLAVDIMVERQENWNGTYPWDEQHRGKYMVVEPDLDDLWENQILARRSRDQIKDDAAKGDFRSQVELGHLRRVTPFGTIQPRSH